MPQMLMDLDNRNKKWRGEASHNQLHQHLGTERTTSTQSPSGTDRITM